MIVSRVDAVVEQIEVIMERIHVMYELSPLEAGGDRVVGSGASAVRRASLDLSKALANLRKSDYVNLPGEK